MIRKQLTPDEIWDTPETDPVAQFLRNYEANAEQRRLEHNQHPPGVGVYRALRDGVFWPAVYSPIRQPWYVHASRALASLLPLVSDPKTESYYSGPDYQSPWESPTSLGAVLRNIGKQSLRQFVGEGLRRQEEFNRTELNGGNPLSRAIVLAEKLHKLDKINSVNKKDPSSEFSKTALAKQLAQQGVDPDEIWRQAQREFIDGHWFGETEPLEIDPSKLPTLEKEIPKWVYTLSPRARDRYIKTSASFKPAKLELGDIVKNPDSPYFQLFPKRKNAKTVFLPIDLETFAGTRGKTLYFNSVFTHSGKGKPSKSEKNLKEINGAFNHEEQHVRDIAAKLPRGGSEEIAKKALKENQLEVANALTELLTRSGASSFDEIPAEFKAEYDALTKRAAYLDTLKDRSVYDIYSLMWDEMMARIAEVRSQKTPEWRRDNRPTKTPDPNAKNTGMKYPDFSKALR